MKVLVEEDKDKICKRCEVKGRGIIVVMRRRLRDGMVKRERDSDLYSKYINRGFEKV